MIKRDGVVIMNARSKNVSIAKETLEIWKQGSYTAPSGKVIDVADAFHQALAETQSYLESPLLSTFTLIIPIMELVNETTAQGAVRLLASGKDDLVALNFASARNPGGGFLAGAIAQEEDLCRCSGLYPCIKSKPIIYNQNILCEDSFYTDNMIYSPKVPFIRDDNNLLLEEPFYLSIISAPAPNIRAMWELANDPNDVDEDFTCSVAATLLKRSIKILQVAQEHGHKNIILGAWGCGAYGNNVDQVVANFFQALEKVPVFEHVCFSVYDNRPQQPIFTAFKQAFDLLRK